MYERPETSSPTDLIQAAITRAGGVIPFAEFMELALYAPHQGYYERSARTVGRAGDFYTSVSVGPVFGELLAFRFAEELARFSAESVVHLVEAGAHDGRLAADLLGGLRSQRPDLFRRLRFWFVEPSPIRREWQSATLRDFASQISWAKDFAELGHQTDGACGVIYSNELLDAFPLHRVAWDARQGRWNEQGVTWLDSHFGWRTLTKPSAAIGSNLAKLNALPSELKQMLPDGFTTELNPAAVEWWSAAARTLRAGLLITLDYGLIDEEFLLPQRATGTLRSYSHHRPSDDVLSRPGERDLTAHVNFSALREAGEAAGLETEAFTSQRQWLTELLAKTVQAEAAFPLWDSGRVRQFQTLTHPDHLGRAFRVLVQRR